MSQFLLPKDKFDTDAAERIVAVGMSSIETILAEILEWMADFNWPVAPVLLKAFSGLGIEVVPHIKNILRGQDDIWKYWMIQQVIPLLSSEAQLALHHEIVRISEPPTQGEITEEVALEAEEYLAKKRYEEK